MSNEFYIPRSGRLSSLVAAVWQINMQSQFRHETIIPKGIVEIIFDLSAEKPVPIKVGEKNVTPSKCFINGFNTTPVELQLPLHHFFFGVQFHAFAIRHLFRIPASEFSNHVVDLSLLDKEFTTLWHKLAEAKTFQDRVEVITEWTEQKFIASASREHLLNTFLSRVDTHHFTVKQLAEQACYSPRQLSRKLTEATGMNTEQLLLYKKYLHSLKMVHKAEIPLTDIAYLSKFSDQSHFIKTFKNFTRLTPGEYVKQKGFLPGHIFKDVR